MAGILSLVFFEGAARKVLNTKYYYGAFSSLAVIAVSGMLLTRVIGFSTKHGSPDKQLVQSVIKRL